MPNRKSTTHLPPFPSNIDRDKFGHWLSGFTDGEGCFYLRCVPLTKPRVGMSRQARFLLNLRADDSSVLKLIQSYWGCGIINKKKDQRNSNPSLAFTVSNIYDLIHTVVPHFDKYPLYAKKEIDFILWKEAVLLMNESINRRNGITRVPWSEKEKHRFDILRLTLKEARKYKN